MSGRFGPWSAGYQRFCDCRDDASLRGCA
ncbi:hypothetical protein [Zymobacter sp. IVIA_5232.4 C2]